MARSDDPRGADAFDFVDAYMASVERGEDLPLAHWLERFPESQEAVAREWLGLRGAAAADEAGAAQAVIAAAGREDGRIGPYRLLRELGSGGQGSVFLADDTRLARRVALKVLTTHFDAIADEKLRRFRREAEIIARLEHPSLCTVYEADIEGQVPYIAMRFVDGRTLAEILGEARRADDASGHARLDAGDETRGHSADVRFPPRTTLEQHQVFLFFERAARALHAAHEAGVVHRDVKPGNVMVNADGKPVILDFGLARDQRADAARITESGDVFGTPAYMSSEQLELPSDALDRRTDVYSLGVTLYEALTLRRPFEQASRSALYLAIQREPVPDPRRFNAALGEDIAVVLETALEKDRERRYATALDLAEDLRRIRQYEPIRARPAGLGLRFARWVRRHPALAAATIGTILSLSIGLAVSLRLLARERQAVADKDAAMSVALGKHLAQRSIQLAPQDASAALALGLDGAERAPGYLTRSALYPALEGCWLERVLAGEPTARVVSDLEIDQRGARVAAAFDDGIILLWSLTHRGRPARLAAHAARVESVAFDPAGRRLASGSADGTVRVWDVERAAEELAFRLGGPLASVAFAPDGSRILARTADGALRVLDPATGGSVSRDGSALAAVWCGSERVAALEGGLALLLAASDLETHAAFGAPEQEALCLDVARDGRSLVYGTARGEVQRVDLERGTLAVVAGFRDGAVRAVNLDPSAQRFVCLVGGGDAVLPWVHDLPSGRSTALHGHGQRMVNAAVFSPDGARIATASHDLTVRIWHAATGAPSRVFTLPLRHIDVRWSADGRRVVSRSVSGYAHVWFAAVRPDTYDLEGHTGAIRSLESSPDGRTLLTASDDGTARLWHVPPSAEPEGARLPGQELRVFRHDGPVSAARFLGRGERCATGGLDGAVHVWNLAHEEGPGDTLRLGRGVSALASGGDGTWIGVLGADGSAWCWAPGRGAAPRRVAPPVGAARATCLGFLHDGERLVIGWDSGCASIHRAETTMLLAERSFAGPGQRAPGIIALDVHPFTDEITVACSDLFVRFWTPGRVADARREVKASELRSVRWDARGELVLALGRKGGRTVRIIDPARNDPVGADNPHAGDVTCADIDREGALALTGASDGSVFLWSARNGDPFVQRTDFRAAVRCSIFAPDGTGLRVITGLDDGRVCVWPADPVPAARVRKPRSLADWEHERERSLAAPLDYD